MYHPGNDTWTRLNNATSPRIGHGCGVADIDDGMGAHFIAAGSHMDKFGTSVERYSVKDGLWEKGRILFYDVLMPDMSNIYEACAIRSANWSLTRETTRAIWGYGYRPYGM